MSDRFALRGGEVNRLWLPRLPRAAFASFRHPTSAVHHGHAGDLDEPTAVKVLRVSPHPVEVYDRQGRRVFASDAFIKQIGAEAISMGDAASAGRASALRAALAGAERVVPFELGDGHAVEARFIPITDGGRVENVAAFYGASSPTNRSSDMPPVPLQSSDNATPVERQLRFVIDMIPQLIWSTRPDGFHDFYNRRWYEYIGASAEQTQGAGWNDPVHPDDQQRAWMRWQQSLQTGEPYEIEYRFRRHDGVYRWFLGRALPMRDESGAIIRWFGTCTDIDEQRRLVEQRAEVLAQAEANSRMKDEFLATVSHELRTPLTSILGWARLVRKRPELSDKAIEVIERNSQALARLIEEILETSRIITGKVRLEAGVVDLAAIVRESADTVRPSAEAKGITIAVDTDGALPAHGDASRLQQVVWNLLNNAVKFTDRGGAIQLGAHREQAEIVITVRDTGKGIAREFLPYVFDRFRQAESSSTRAHGGLGLGLAIVRHLVELHGGSVGAESPGPGQGATFQVRLPFLETAIEARDPVARAISERPSVASEVRLDGVRLLLVEDEPDARELIASVLRDAGATVCEAASVDLALEAIASEPFDAIISDVGMPHRDGYALARELRGAKNAKIAATPAMALTAFARAEDAERAAREGFDAHFAKPIEPDALVLAVLRLLRSAR